MERNFRAQALALAVLGFGIAGSALAAEVGEVTVTAPREFKRQSQQILSKNHETMVTLSTVVSYKDLDLKTQSGAADLEGRVKEAAGDICKKLDTLYPDFADPQCVNNSVKTTMVQVNAAVASAKK